LFLGVGLSFATYFLDDRMKRVEDVEHALGLSLIAVVPPMEGRKAPDRSRAVERAPFSPASEAFRSLRASLALRKEWPDCRRILVTSTTAGEGKSTVASNLALVLAQSGQRTLLIDADMRRPTLQTVYGADAEAGLSEHLAGRAPLDRVVVATETPNLHVVVAGAFAANPSELLASAAMRAMLEECGRRFDRIVLDCPPIFGVSDPVSLLPAVNAVVFVVHYGKTGRRAAVRAMGKVREGVAPLVGVVFNNVAVRMSSGYYYYYQYHKYGHDARVRERPPTPHDSKA
jgi:capsular exopolysaccharide synthesis family protein